MPCSSPSVGYSSEFSYFAAYEVTKKFLTPPGSSPAELNLGAIIVAGGTAGIAMWALAIPPDVRMTTTSENAMLIFLLGFEIPPPVCSYGNIFWLYGLCEENNSTGWCQSAMERLRTCNGKGMC